jgi:enoyl-CoA hydratase/carnithine racemase
VLYRTCPSSGPGSDKENKPVSSVLSEFAHGVAVITINRPEARNAVNLEVANGIAAAIAANGPLAVRATKQIMAMAIDYASADAFAAQREFVAPVFTSADAQEGARAFAEKRAPVWKGE